MLVKNGNLMILDEVYMLVWSAGENVTCSHWTHLKTGTEVRVLGRDSVFRCPHCANP